MYKKIRIYITKTLITIIITLIVLILMKGSSKFKKQFYTYVYDTNFSFTKISNWYNKYFGKIIKMPVLDQPVFNEKFNYSKSEPYLDGVNLYVDSNYFVPIQESGLVVFVGKKDNYGDVVIIQQVNGIDMWYGNMKQIDVKLYDYVEKGKLLGEVDNNLYLVFKKNGEILNYEDQI